jgi:hypothetical protein
MRKINRVDVIRLVLVLSLVAGMGLAFGAIGRFVPTHMIEMPVYCGSCHPEEVQELGATTHLGKFADVINQTYANIQTGSGASAHSLGALDAGLAISGGCMLCHNYWDNMEWFGVRNFTVQPYDNTSDMFPNSSGFTMPTDIYGNAVSPYGLASTTEYVMNATYNGTLGLGNSYPAMIAIPWAAGLDTYQYTDPNGVTFSRVDYVWSKLSSLSPGPVGFLKINSTTGATNTCGSGNAEHGMCHIGKDAVAESFASQRASVQEFPAVPQNGTQNFSKNGMTFAGKLGAGDFFRHEMAFTTAQYAAVNIKICGACHVFKLPPMQWGGEPWSLSDINFAAGHPIFPAGPSGYNDDPFGFRPTYNSLDGTSSILSHGTTKTQVMFRTPDFAHSNVKCIRCHVHAGINGETVTDNAANTTITAIPGPSQ